MAELGETVKSKVTACPYADGFGEEVSVPVTGMMMFALPAARLLP